MHELKMRIDEDKYKAQELAMTMINNNKEQQEALIARIEAQQAQDMQRKTQEHEATKHELQTYLERFGHGATCTSGNAAKGHEGEQQVMKLLEEYMPLVKRSYDHHHANETGKNAVGHSADIGITCNGIDVLIEVELDTRTKRNNIATKPIRNSMYSSDFLGFVIVEDYIELQ